MSRTNPFFCVIASCAVLLASTACQAAIAAAGAQDRGSPSTSRQAQRSAHGAAPRTDRIDAGAAESARSRHLQSQIREFKQMSPAQQRQVRRAYRYYHSLPKSRQHELRQQWRHEDKNRRSTEDNPRRQNDPDDPGRH